MPTPQELLQSALSHHRAGRLRPAEEVYRQLLLDNPDHPEALHGVGLLAMQSSRPDLAAAYLARATLVSPNVAVYHHNLGEAWMLAGDLNQAIACLRRAVWLDPARPESHAILGVALSHLQRFKDAADSLEQAVRLGADRPEIHQHLANALLQQSRFAEAESFARKATDRAPNSAESWQTLGESLAAQNRPDDAIASLRQALRLRPDYPPALSQLGSLLLQRNLDEGIALLRKAVQLRPDHLDSHIELARGLELARRYPEAADAFEAILKITPDNENVKFHVAALRGQNAPAAPPPALVAALFDRHAETFDEHLTQSLHYRVPQLLHDAVTPTLPSASNLDILDLGCGTGLCAPLFLPIAKTLTGIDLSPAMIEKARQRNLYDRLEVTDAVTALRAAPSTYDLIVAADVLCYIGDLTDVFRAAASSLRPAALFTFSVELDNSPANPTPGYRLRPSRRYSHKEKYIRQSAESAGFQIQSLQQQVLRREADKDVTGMIVVLRKP